MENYIVINGKKAELTPEQLKALGLEREIKNPFERKRTQRYYAIGVDGRLDTYIDDHDQADDTFYAVANYCTDREMMQQRALHETLNRLLWRYSMEHGGSEIDWNNHKEKSSIVYDHCTKNWSVSVGVSIQYIGAPYFATRKTAYDALAKIVEPFMAEHPDFKF